MGFGSATSILLLTLSAGSGCGDISAQQPNSGHAGSVGVSGGAGASAGGSTSQSAGAAGQSAGSGGTNASGGGAGVSGGGAAGSSAGSGGSGGNSAGGSSGAGGVGSICTKTTGCTSDEPVCDTAANNGEGQCNSFKVLAFYTVYDQMPDLAHRSYSKEANGWFPSVAAANGFSYESTTDWSRLSTISPSDYQLIMFFDNRPTETAQQDGFKAYVEKGGAYIGFHVSAYNDTEDRWAWFSDTFLATGLFVGNTWHPTPANLKIEDGTHPVTQGIGDILKTSANEWYSWEKDLRQNPDVKILLSVDPSSFPLGNGPKPTEIWHSGYYPVVWSNTKYKMLYVNMGHNDMDYDGGTNAQLSWTFRTKLQDQMLLQGIHWLVGAQGPVNVVKTD